ncbi:hypothetical protein ACSFRN_000451, partial [Escherichia coli]
SWQHHQFFSLNYKLTKRIYFITFIYNKG